MNLIRQNEQKFQEAYKRLNQRQKEAVDAVEGPVMVLAGPGTGKTQILTLRLANILRRVDVAPENILALTFTTAAVSAMRERLSEIIGGEIAYRVGIHTFHGFCEEQIVSDPERFPFFAAAEVADDVSRTKIIHEVLSELKLKRLKTFASQEHYVSDIARAIDEIKREGLSVESFRTKIKEQKTAVLNDENSYYRRNGRTYKKGELKKDALKDVEKNLELAEVYERYQEKMKENSLYDFTDMITAVLEKLENDEDYRLSLQEKFQYLLVDEHQDTNEAQLRLITALGEAPHLDAQPNIFVVGDVKQSIYRFAGAGTDNFDAFRRLFRKVREISLVDNYRSRQSILDAAYEVISQSEVTPAGERLEAAGSDGERKKSSLPRFRILPDYETELAFVMREVKNRIASGTSPREIAIFYRNHKHLSDIVAACEREGVPFVVASGRNALADEDLRGLFWLLRAAAEPGNDTSLSRALLAEFVSLDTIDVLNVFAAVRRARKKQPLVAFLRDRNFLKRAGVNRPQNFVDFVDFLSHFARKGENLSFDAFLEEFVRESGFLEHILAKDEQREKLGKLKRVFVEIKRRLNDRVYRLSDFLSDLETMERYDISLEVPWDRETAAVRLMTAHASKGLEFDVVCITNAADHVWGKRRETRKFKLPIAQFVGDVEDERRLFYVAMTRARKELLITFSRLGDTGKEQSPVRFLEDIEDKFLDRQTVEENFDETFFLPRRTVLPGFLTPEYIKDKFFRSNLSASTLNNYLESPLRYFFRNIVVLPQSESKELVFGNLVHGALEDYFRLARKNGKPPSQRKLLEFFRQHLEQIPLPESDYKEISEHGRRILAEYYKQHHRDFLVEVKVEEWMGQTEFETDFAEPVKMVGKIDKLEFLGENLARETQVRVIDYKTGRPWSKLSRERRQKLERQMTFYKFLLERDSKARYRLSESALHFIDPNDKGICEIRVIVPTDEDIAKLQEEIKGMIKDISSGEIINRIARDAEKARKDRTLSPLVPLWQALCRSSISEHTAARKLIEIEK